MDRAFSVSYVNNYIKNLIGSDAILARIAVKGEASNVKYSASGHIYFTLKDESGQLPCVMFAGQLLGLDFALKDGQAIVVYGRIGVYERDGRYQLYANKIVKDGVGRLYELYEALKKQLEAEGLFDPSRKRAIPAFPKTVGIVTAETGAAIRDIINISRRRNPYVELILSPSLVQGEQAPESIVRAIRRLEALKPDVMIVGRGGGSIEDLWAFNDERVARAIAGCTVPVISAVGHETDTTIADYVADLRAPTPSAAAELAVWDLGLFEERLSGYSFDLYKNMAMVLERMRSKAQYLQAKLKASGPQQKLMSERQYADDLARRLELVMNGIFSAYKASYEEKKDRLKFLMDGLALQKRHAFEVYIERMKGLSPLDRLKSGYAFVTDTEGRAVTKAAALQKGDGVRIDLADGYANAVVKETGSRSFS